MSERWAHTRRRAGAVRSWFIALSRRYWWVYAGPFILTELFLDRTFGWLNNEAWDVGGRSLRLSSARRRFWWLGSSLC